MRHKKINEINNIHLKINNRGAFKGHYEGGEKYLGVDFAVANFPYMNGRHLQFEQRNMELTKDGRDFTSVAPSNKMFDPMSDIKKKSKVEKERIAELRRHLKEPYMIKREGAIFLFGLKSFDSDFYINHYSKALVHSPKFSIDPVADRIISKLKNLCVSGKTLSAKIKEQKITVGKDTQAYGVTLTDWFQYGRTMDYKICGDICYPAVDNKRTIKLKTKGECINFSDAYNHPLIRSIYSLSNINRHILFTLVPLLADDYTQPIDVVQCLKNLGFTDDEINFLYQLSKCDYKRTYIDYAIDFKDGECVVNHIPGGAKVAPDTQEGTCPHCIADNSEQHPCSTDNNQVAETCIIPIRSNLFAGSAYNLIPDFSQITADVKGDILWRRGEKSWMPFTSVGDNILLNNNNILSDSNIFSFEVGKYSSVTRHDISRHGRWHTFPKWRDIRLKKVLYTLAFMHLVSNIWRGPPVPL